MKILKLAAVVFSLTLVACDDEANTTALNAEPEVLNITPYPEEMRSGFMANCIRNGGVEELCTCVLTEMERTVPLEDMVAAAEQVRGGGSVSTEYTDRIVEANVRCALASTNEASTNEASTIETDADADTSNAEEAPVP